MGFGSQPANGKPNNSRPVGFGASGVPESPPIEVPAEVARIRANLAKIQAKPKPRPELQLDD
jgi:hypothetical protein